MWVLQGKTQLLTVILIFLQYSQNGCIVTMEKNTIAKKNTLAKIKIRSLVFYLL